ncbi:hypothetical protein BH18ACT14_BH18ACT14_14230 [soil metagenome]
MPPESATAAAVFLIVDRLRSNGNPPNGCGAFAGMREGKDDAVWIRRIVLMWLAKRAWQLVRRTRARRAARASART